MLIFTLKSVLPVVTRLLLPWVEYINSILIGFILLLVIATPILAIILLLLQRNDSMSWINNIAFLFSSTQLFFSIFILFFFWIQPFYGTIHLFLGRYDLGGFNFNFVLGIDGLSAWFVILTTLTIHLCIIYTANFDLKERKRYFILLFISSFCLVIFFLALDIFLFYIAFESVLIPLFLMIGYYGSRERRIHASLQFVFYTLIGSFFMLFAIMYIYDVTHTTLFTQINAKVFTITEQRFLWAAFAIALAVKIPLVPIHIWLPEAHVEAPTVGSVLLAAVVLKMGGFGIIRILLGIFYDASYYFQSLVFTLGIVGLTYAALTALRQNDIKKIIAYSSVVHMGYATLGLFSFNVLTISSSILAMLAHGLISGGLFFSMGCLYDRYQTRDLRSYGALNHFSPLLAWSFFFLLISNVAFPGTANFPAELGIFIGLFLESWLLTILLVPGLVFNGTYNIWLATRLIFGPYNEGNAIYSKALDLTIREKFILGFIWNSVMFMGIFLVFLLLILFFLFAR